MIRRAAAAVVLSVVLVLAGASPSPGQDSAAVDTTDLQSERELRQRANYLEARIENLLDEGQAALDHAREYLRELNRRIARDSVRSLGEPTPPGRPRFEVLDSTTVRVSWSPGTNLDQYIFASTTAAGRLVGDTTLTIEAGGGDLVCLYSLRLYPIEAGARSDSVCNRIATDSTTSITSSAQELIIDPDSATVAVGDSARFTAVIILYRDSAKTEPIGCTGPDCWRYVDRMRPAIISRHGEPHYLTWPDSNPGSTWVLRKMKSIYGLPQDVVRMTAGG